MKKRIWSALAAGMILINCPVWGQVEINPPLPVGADSGKAVAQDKIFSSIDQMPEFPGGHNSLMGYFPGISGTRRAL